MLNLNPKEQIWSDVYRKALIRSHSCAFMQILYSHKARGDTHEDSHNDMLLMMKDGITANKFNRLFLKRWNAKQCVFHEIRLNFW